MYEKLFDANNPFWRSMSRTFDAFELNLLWMLCCLPVFTAGPATIAVYYALINILRGEEGYVHKDFFRSFKRNFKQGILAGLLVFGLGAFLVVDIVIARQGGHGIYAFLMVFFSVFFLLWCLVSLYVFPLLAKFDNSLKNTFLLAFTMAFKNLPKTLLMFLELAVALWLCHLLPGLIFIAPGVAALLHANILVKLFQPWLPEPNADLREDYEEASLIGDGESGEAPAEGGEERPHG